MKRPPHAVDLAVRPSATERSLGLGIATVAGLLLLAHTAYFDHVADDADGAPQ